MSSPVSHYTTKQRVDYQQSGLRFSTHPLPLKRLFLIEQPDNGQPLNRITISPLTAGEAFIKLVSYSYKLDIQDSATLSDEFEMLTRAVARPLFYKLILPYDFSLLPDVLDAVLGNVKDNPASTDVSLDIE